MACPGGCVAGAGTVLPMEQAAKLVLDYTKTKTAITFVMAVFIWTIILRCRLR